MSLYILDTSALLCYLRDEAGAEKVARILKKDCGMHRVNLGEVYYGVLKRDGLEKANEVYGALLQYPIRFIDDLTDAMLLTTGKFKVIYHLGFADSFAAATACLNSAFLVTKDNDFRPVGQKGLVKIVWI